MTTGNNITDASIGRLNKAKRAMGARSTSFIGNVNIATNLRINYYNALVTSIILYCIHIQSLSETTISQIQPFQSSTIRCIISGKYSTNETPNANLQIRRQYSIPEIKSMLLRRYLIQIYTWRATMSFAHLNNKSEITKNKRLQ